MKKFSSEFCYNYKTYTFGYGNYCIREPSDRLSDIYAQGYLPYSGSPGVKNTFYMARSARVLLKVFEFSSENRRVAKKFDGRFRKEKIPFKDFKFTEDFFSFCAEYFAKRHGPSVMPVSRLKTILEAELVTDIIVYRSEEKIAAYVFEVADDSLSHFWYSFYDLALIHQSLGMWLLLDVTRDAKLQGKQYFYVGTVYGEKALYKTAFEDLEYWNGQEWSANIVAIKQLGRSDEKRTTTGADLWKEERGIF